MEHQRPVWLLSRDTEQFRAPPLTTAGLKAFYLQSGSSAGDTAVELEHFLDAGQLESWLGEAWPHRIRPQAERAVANGGVPVIGLSCYTWNVAEFLDIARLVKRSVPEMLVVAGGPHVQRAQDYLFDEAIDVVVLGEGEETFAALLDCPSRAAWDGVAGIAFARDGALVCTPERPRQSQLDCFPSPLDVLELRDPAGAPVYERVAYETSRGCPYRCSFCEWGTGAIGTKIWQHSMDRIRSDVERLIAGGVHDLWLCDSNFGALREDEAKADLMIELRQQTGLPNTFATSWSKNHNARVQRIVRRLHGNGLLPHYHLALQTLTPRALEECNRTNMRANDYEPIVKQLAADGVPVAAELIWGLPGDTLAEFEANLDQLMTVFPNVNIFGYTLLPGTDFFDRREELALQTIPVAGYGKAKGEYVVGCNTFGRAEGEEGYFMIAAYVLFARGQIMPRTLRFLALTRCVGVSTLARKLLEELLREFGEPTQRMPTYERRAEVYLRFLRAPARTYALLSEALRHRLEDLGLPELIVPALQILELDAATVPRTGARVTVSAAFGWNVARVERALEMMELPDPSALALAPCEQVVTIEHPGGVGEILLDPDGGEWMRGRLLTAHVGGEKGNDLFDDA